MIDAHVVTYIYIEVPRCVLVLILSFAFPLTLIYILSISVKLLSKISQTKQFNSSIQESIVAYLHAHVGSQAVAKVQTSTDLRQYQ